jgi:hypothetical protein
VWAGNLKKAAARQLAPLSSVGFGGRPDLWVLVVAAWGGKKKGFGGWLELN